MSRHSYDYGTVFKLAPDGTESVLHTFAGGSDGAYPAASLIADKTGNIYGTTLSGGRYDYGTVFKLSPDGRENILYNFDGTNEGGAPAAGLLAGKNGQLYGTASGGGASGNGTVFALKK